MKKIKEVLSNKEGNHILPFLWMHGEDEETTRHYLQQISSTGIKATCIESRPHPDFLGAKWWEDVDIILDESKKLGMSVWILDDEHFPTGYAAGKIKNEYPHLQKVYLKMQQLDFVGPKKRAGILLDWMLYNGKPNIMSVGVEKDVSEETDSDVELKFRSKIKKVIAAKKLDYEQIDETSLVDVTSYIKDSVLYWDVPEGAWSFFCFIETQDGGEIATEGYLNPLVPEATDVLINTVYESHYRKYREEFGNTIKGFFSDEPRFGNIKGPEASIGRIDMPLPWCNDLLELLSDSFGEDCSKYLPLLFRGDSRIAYKIRFQYMELVSNLYSKNFSERIGAWCKKHGVEYIGHVIEDNNAHARLGYGSGHFFKSMKGQDMSGIDVVLHQLVPEQDQGYFKSFTSTGWDGEFFHYALAKMGSSLGHLDLRKQGRTMCEVFGAYGWAEGLKLMNWIANHMLVRGVNYFVPHAFSMKNYPDADCPPHFYAHGHNPQFKYMDNLIHYMNRVSHLLSDGKHIAPVAVLYHAESEWSGDYMLLQKPAKILTQNQIDFDIVSAELIINSTIQKNKMKIANEEFNTVIIPFSEALPKELIHKIVQLAEAGTEIIFLENYPSFSSENEIIQTELAILKQSSSVISLDNLADYLKSKNLHEIESSNFEPSLRYYHYKHEDGHIYMFFNESTIRKIQTNIAIPDLEKFSLYNPIENKVTKLVASETLELTLAQGESIILFEDNEGIGEVDILTNESVIPLNAFKWNLSFADSEKYPKIEKYQIFNELPLLGAGDEYSSFSGTVRYETQFETENKKVELFIEDAQETVSVYVNDIYIGTKISNPYTFELTNATKEGQNSLRIEVTNTLGNSKKDYLSQFMYVEPIGINGEVLLKVKR
ncbi:glycosyl hydrolase [Peribacillus sp. NPDC096379]|uniref:glycosyl hydrolase n=1 Tax=Peribacillus sp. NPDC096379 TaxID=3364393 RepID=UPI00382A231D